MLPRDLDAVDRHHGGFTEDRYQIEEDREIKLSNSSARAEPC